MISKLAARAFPALLLLGCGVAHAEGWLETRVAIEEFAVERDYEAAFALGDELVAQAEVEFGASSTQLVDAHVLLASLYRQVSNFEDAELHLLRAIDVVEIRDGVQATTLIPPLLALGDTYFDAGSYQEAIATYEEARAHGRREFGLLYIDQLEIVQRMSSAALMMSDYDQARALQREMAAIVQRVHGENSIEFVDAQFRLATWFMRLGKVDDARRVYTRIQAIAREQFHDDPLLAIRILRTKATALRNADPEARADRTNPLELEQALEIAAALEEPNPLLEAEILRDIGDWYVCLSRYSDVAMPYMQSWAVLETVEDGFKLQHDWFGPLTLVCAPPFNSRLISREPDAPWGRLEIAFTLDAMGRASEVRITRSDPAGLIDDAAVRQIMASKFRPRLDRGRPIATEATIGWDFQYVAEPRQSVTAVAPAVPATPDVSTAPAAE